MQALLSRLSLFDRYVDSNSHRDLDFCHVSYEGIDNITTSGRTGH